ncbi:predicted protein [Phaeodactylum tricornutum CCAP 1055/1]|jgi:hypothetical protein|uniref:Glutaredoxin-like protein n=1 Tax=Phaeodactylum tricornutum (strain CCAP 1055/1) TaxID=556484 RepID=B7FZR6_PHATC|nr:predicted protein [Phaeodactylum tricornutum CCAP 1055/1]EEC48385.1 predicted protein [Phaeodactylum tricornutum CCAP 1055/1]|eukprot:XP_002180194.1 predicted protein [Phaeodactylum tricornutum CCAP 1055/1]
MTLCSKAWAFRVTWPVLPPSARKRPALGFRVQQRLFRSTKSLPASVSGSIYTCDDSNAPRVRLFTKEGCTLCDKVKGVLVELKAPYPHCLEQVDITDKENAEWFDRYKYDIPVLHLDGKYWTKHRLTTEEAIRGLKAFGNGAFESQAGEPNAARMERK